MPCRQVPAWVHAYAGGCSAEVDSWREVSAYWPTTLWVGAKGTNVTGARTATVFLAIATILAACGGDGSVSATTTAPSVTTTTLSVTTTSVAPERFPPEDLHGAWEIARGYVVTFGVDGSWDVAPSSNLDKPSDFGHYELDGTALTITSTPAIPCGAGAQGVYDLSHGDNQGELQLVKVRDSCSIRAGYFVQGFTRRDS